MASARKMRSRAAFSEAADDGWLSGTAIRIFYVANAGEESRQKRVVGEDSFKTGDEWR
jgi:hypothetical protein